jgi:endoglycosylceramidase
LGRYYERALTAIRSAETSARRGFRHIVFFEPMATWSALSAGVSPGLTPFTSDTDVVYSPHLYAGSLTADTTLANGPVIPVSFGFSEATTEAARYGTAVWTGEWGWFGDPATDGSLVAEFGRNEDQYLMGGAWWDWKQACGDPHQIGSPGAAPRPVADGLVRFACPSGQVLGMPAPFVVVLSRAYPRAAIGRLTALASDPARGVLDMAGRANGAGEVELWAPGRGRPTPPAVTGADVGPGQTTAVTGGWLITVPVLRAGRYAIHLQPSPRR